jgi:hypothetical protein
MNQPKDQGRIQPSVRGGRLVDNDRSQQVARYLVAVTFRKGVTPWLHQQDVVPQAGLHGWFTGAANLLLQDSRSSGSQSELIWAAV